MSDHDDDTCPHLVRASLLEAENARLKAEVERLRASSFVTAVPVEQYERVIKAGDDLSASLTIHSNHPNCGARDEWLRAKKGLPSLAQQWEREKNNKDRAAKEGKPSV
jgi:hypothetical protein